MIISMLTICSFSFLSFMALLGFKRTREYFLRYSRKELAMMLFAFITIALQMLILDKEAQYVAAGWQMVVGIMLYFSTLMLIIIFIKHKNSEGMLEVILILGVLQIAIAMTIASATNIHWGLKVLSNLIYLTIPSFAIYILTRPKEETKNKPELLEKEIPQSKGED